LNEVREETETAWDLAQQAEQLRSRAPSAAELASLREGTLQRLWHELLTPVALLRAAWEQLDRIETDPKKRRPLRRIGNAAERLAHGFDLLNDILWARQDSRTRVSAAQLAAGLIDQAGTQLLVELGNAGLVDDAAPLRAAVLRLADHARAMTPLVDEESVPLALEPAIRGAVTAALAGAQREVEVTVTARGNETLPPRLLSDALTALLKNAFASTPDGSRIDVRASRGPGGLAIEVQDHGVGMPEARLRAVLAGLDAARDPTWYTSGKALAFGSGGAGLDLVRLQALGRWRGWKFEAVSRQCAHVDAEGRGCPGDARRCDKIAAPADCARMPKGTLFRILAP
jgi:signal transduction histidine kinase